MPRTRMWLVGRAGPFGELHWLTQQRGYVLHMACRKQAPLKLAYLAPVEEVTCQRCLAAYQRYADKAMQQNEALTESLIMDMWIGREELGEKEG